jgi:NAD(P)-dependent dehydrogenase (short-subunit alcohol dehydrogenase family)
VALAPDVFQQDETVGHGVSQAASAYGRIDVLVHNAGYILEGAVEERRLVLLSSNHVFGVIPAKPNLSACNTDGSDQFFHLSTV